MFKIKEGDIMATRSFTDTYMVDKKNIKKIHDIITKPQSIHAKKIVGHKDVKGHAISKMLGIEK